MLTILQSGFLRFLSKLPTVPSYRVVTYFTRENWRTCQISSGHSNSGIPLHDLSGSTAPQSQITSGGEPRGSFARRLKPSDKDNRTNMPVDVVSQIAMPDR
jgi:hypothetical protein